MFCKIISLEHAKAFNKITKLKNQLEILYDEIDYIDLHINTLESKEYNDDSSKKDFSNQRLILITNHLNLKHKANDIQKKIERLQLKQVSKETLKQFPGLQWTLFLHRCTQNKSESESDSD